MCRGPLCFLSLEGRSTYSVRFTSTENLPACRCSSDRLKDKRLTRGGLPIVSTYQACRSHSSTVVDGYEP